MQNQSRFQEFILKIRRNKWHIQISLVPRQEVLRKEGIEGVIDIENLRDQKKKYLESRAEDFFDLTYPTSDLSLYWIIYIAASIPKKKRLDSFC